MISYSYEAKHPTVYGWGKITIETDNVELYTLIEDMIKAAVDATSWRNRVEKVEDAI